MIKFLSKAYLGIIFSFLYLPIFILIIFSFNESKNRAKFTGFSFKWYIELFSNELIIKSLFNTLLIGFLSAIIATFIGTIAAIGIMQMNKKNKSFLLNLSYIPIINPEIVTGVSLMMLFVFLNKIFGLELGFMTVLLSHITFCLPYVVLNVMPKLRQVDPSMYEAAQDLGCNPKQAFYKVVLPDIMPGIFSGFLMTFTLSIDDFVVTYFTSGSSFQTLPVTIYSMTRKKVNPQINAISSIIFLVVLIVLILINLKEAKKHRRVKI